MDSMQDSVASAKKNQLMNKMIVLRDSTNPNPVHIPEYVQVTHDPQPKKTKKKKIFKFKLEDIKKKSLHNLLFVEKLQKKKPSIRIPKLFLNILYSHKIKNYNPYLETLKELSNKHTLSFSIQNKIKKLCYMGLVRQVLINKKNVYNPPYNPVGILIRNYMLKPMKLMREQTEKNKNNTIFIHVNNSGLSFNPQSFPNQIAPLMTRKKYSQIIGHINKIIQNQYIEYKTNNQSHLNNHSTYSEFGIFFIMLLMIVFMMLDIQIEDGIKYAIMALLLVGACIGIVGVYMEGNNRLQSIISSTNVTSKIEAKIQRYLDQISEDGKLVWRVGKDFYWIQIQNAQLKQRKLGDNDYF